MVAYKLEIKINDSFERISEKKLEKENFFVFVNLGERVNNVEK